MSAEMTPERLEEIRKRVRALEPYRVSETRQSSLVEQVMVEAFCDRADLLDAVQERDATIAQQAAEIAALREALRECADDLHDELCNRYRPDHPMRPDERRRFERDMGPVDKARKLLREDL